VKVCTYCGREGHRASHCPTRLHILPLVASDLYWVALLVAIIGVTAAVA
jgi:hypothetical protein